MTTSLNWIEKVERWRFQCIRNQLFLRLACKLVSTWNFRLDGTEVSGIEFFGKVLFWTLIWIIKGIPLIWSTYAFLQTRLNLLLFCENSNNAVLKHCLFRQQKCYTIIYFSQACINNSSHIQYCITFILYKRHIVLRDV